LFLALSARYDTLDSITITVDTHGEDSVRETNRAVGGRITIPDLEQRRKQKALQYDDMALLIMAVD